MITANPINQAAQRRLDLRPTTFWRIREAIPRWLSLMLASLSILTPLALWIVISALHLAPELFLPNPGTVIGAFSRLWGEGVLQADVSASVTRVLGGFLLALLLSAPLGILMGSFTSIRALMEPLLGIVRYMPASAFIPLLILWLGLGEVPKIALIFIGTFFFNTLMVADAVKFVPQDWISAAYTLGASRRDVIRSVIWPAIKPSIIDAARVNLAASWNLVIVAELVAASSGLGFRILKAQRFLRTDEIFVNLIVIGLIGVAFDLSFRLLQRRLCPWIEAARAS